MLSINWKETIVQEQHPPKLDNPFTLASRSNTAHLQTPDTIFYSLAHPNQNTTIFRETPDTQTFSIIPRGFRRKLQLPTRSIYRSKRTTTSSYFPENPISKRKLVLRLEHHVRSKENVISYRGFFQFSQTLVQLHLNWKIIQRETV